MIRSIIVALLIATFAIPGASVAQTFVPATDTVFMNIGGLDHAEGFTSISVPGAGPKSINWKVVASDFPADWLRSGEFGFCDDGLCYTNIGDTFLWDKPKAKGRKLDFTYYGGSGPFTCVLEKMHGKTVGCFYAAVQFTDIASGGTIDTITFVVCSNTLGILAAQSAANDDIVLYPNPANNELNVLFGAYNDVKSMVVYNVIGKAMNAWKVAGNSANLDITAMPAGIYFVKLYGSSGNVVATRKFTKQ